MTQGAEAQTVRYTVALAEPAVHLVHVTIDLPPGPAVRDLQLPVWDSLYQVRDFSQHVNRVRVKGAAGQAPVIRKVEKSLWRLNGASSGAEVAYEVFADDPGPYGAQLNPHHAFFNLAQILMYSVESRSGPVEIQFTEVPGGWRIATTLEISTTGFHAPNYDRLVDSPVEIGEFRESDFDEGGAHYRVAVDAEPADYDVESVTSQARRIVASETAWMKDQPFQTYLFLYHFPRLPGGGGMEHAFSTAIEVNARLLGEAPLSLPEVTAHEFFHVWNVKRIRPRSLEPRDFTRENYTPSLWFSEGVSNTVEEYTLLRAGFMGEAQFLSRLATAIREYEQNSAHGTQSVEESSVGAWLEKYDYYRMPGRSISYYNKGQLLGVLLDLSVRESSRGRASLREVFLRMNAAAKAGDFFADSDGVREAAEAVGGGDLKPFFQKYVAGTEEIPWDDFFRTVGLRLNKRVEREADLGFQATHAFGAPPIVVAVAPGGAAEQAGLASGDTLLQINGHAVGEDFQSQFARLHPGDILRLRVRTPQGARELRWRLESREQIRFELEDVENIAPQQTARRAAWLKGESEVPGDRP
jgi:predicted metalloprotease with PDZ domain